MNMAERFIIRLVAYCGYMTLAAAVVTFLFSDVNWLFWLGVLGLLFLADRLIHLGQAEHSLASINSNNIARYLTSTSLSALERAADKASAANGNPFVYLAKFLIENRDIREMLVRLDVEPKEFEQKLMIF